MPLNKTAKKSWVNFNLNENKIFFDKIKSLYTRKKKWNVWKAKKDYKSIAWKIRGLLGFKKYLSRISSNHKIDVKRIEKKLNGLTNHKNNLCRLLQSLTIKEKKRSEYTNTIVGLDESLPKYKKNLEEINSKIQNDKKMNYKLNKELQVWGIIEYNLSQYLNQNEKKK